MSNLDNFPTTPEAIAHELAKIGSFVEHGLSPRVSPSQLAKDLEKEILENALTLEEVSNMLNISTARVHERYNESSLIGFPYNGSIVFPDVQFFNSEELPNWGLVAPSFKGDIHSVALSLFMNQTSTELESHGVDLTPREWLLSGGDVEILKDHIKYAFFEAGR